MSRSKPCWNWRLPTWMLDLDRVIAYGHTGVLPRIGPGCTFIARAVISMAALSATIAAKRLYFFAIAIGFVNELHRFSDRSSSHRRLWHATESITQTRDGQRAQCPGNASSSTIWHRTGCWADNAPPWYPCGAGVDGCVVATNKIWWRVTASLGLWKVPRPVTPQVSCRASGKQWMVAESNVPAHQNALAKALDLAAGLDPMMAIRWTPRSAIVKN